MSNSLDSDFIKAYRPLLAKFVEDTIELENVTDLPEPFLPVYGGSYESAKVKILFYGIDTKRACHLKDFVNQAVNSPEETILNWYKDNTDFDNFDFINWNKYKQGFWGFVLNFLHKFYGIGNLKDLYNREKLTQDKLLSEVVSSFAWANANSIEAFGVTAKGKGVKHEDWEKAKKASLIFDNPKLIIDTLKPNIVVFLNWEGNQGEEWLLKGLDIAKEETLHKDYLYYYYFQNTETHFFWTQHPTRHKFMRINADVLIEEIIEKYRTERSTFSNTV